MPSSHPLPSPGEGRGEGLVQTVAEFARIRQTASGGVNPRCPHPNSSEEKANNVNHHYACRTGPELVEGQFSYATTPRYALTYRSVRPRAALRMYRCTRFRQWPHATAVRRMVQFVRKRMALKVTTPPTASGKRTTCRC